MADETNTQTTIEDDWGAAMAEQAATDSATDPMADWGAAMEEQAKADAATDTATDSSALKPQSATATVFKDFSASTQGSTHNDIDFILDIPVQLTVELGRAKIAIKNLLQLAQGSVVELDGLAGEPMDVLVNGCLIAQGEVVVVNDKFGIRLTDVISPAERIRKLNR
ncbi:MAG: flagellar motor switch protein FliN [Burkholderiaceae bacterium]|nr:flagellar motor switch protein FliN [Burkholderiaceae bacterium]